MDALFITALLAATIRLGMAIGLAAIGEAAAERSGIFNIGIEGIMLSGAFAAAWGSVRTGSPWLGVLFAMIIGVILAGIHAFMVLALRIDQFVMILILAFAIVYLCLTWNERGPDLVAPAGQDEVAAGGTAEPARAEGAAGPATP